MEGAINPALIDAAPSFNLALGAQTVPLTEAIILDTLRKLDRHPRYLVLGITPDYLSEAALADQNTTFQIEAYYKAEEFLEHGPLHKRLLARCLPAFFYRDVVSEDLDHLCLRLKRWRPPREIWRMPFVRPLSWGEYLRCYTVPQTALGWNADVVGPLVAGSYPRAQGIRPRLQPPYRPATARLEEVVRAARRQKIEPMFLIMPFHDTFYEVHGQAVREAVCQSVACVARDLDVIVLSVPFDTSDPHNYYDGHHMSVKGAETLSRGVNDRLRELLTSGEYDRHFVRHIRP
jgi:hypothetical protein